MKRLLGGLLESAHVLAMALLFGAAALLTRLTAPGLFADGLGVSQETAARIFGDLATMVGNPGRALAVVAIIAAVLAPYVRNDDRMGLPWARVVCAVAALAILLTGWGDDGVRTWSETAAVFDADVERHATAAEAIGARADETLTPWNALLIFSGLNLVLAAFQMFGAPGGGSPTKSGKG
jgi:hypothetical protein